jgi:hypothetical protein
MREPSNSEFQILNSEFRLRFFSSLLEVDLPADLHQSPLQD